MICSKCHETIAGPFYIKGCKSNVCVRCMPDVIPNAVTPEQVVDHPAHYGGDTTYEAIKVIEAWELGFNLGNTVKYIARAGKKPNEDAITTLEKALWYLQREIANLKERSEIGVELGLKERNK